VAKAVGIIAAIGDQTSKGTSGADQIVGNADVADNSRG
jgi:hypothetical protein